MGNRWSSNIVFLMAAIGAEAGVVNIWRFSYLAGSSGGAIFVIAYLIALLLIAAPALLAEMAIGRRGGLDMISAVNEIVVRDGLSRWWKTLGYLSFITVLLTSTYYFVICGWMIDYLALAVSGHLTNLDAASAAVEFETMTASPARMLLYSGLLIGMTALIVTRGLKHGIERIAAIFTPARLLGLALLFVYAAVAADIPAAMKFLFTVNPAKFTLDALVVAVGQAFFSLGIGVGVMMTVGAYTPKAYSLPRAVLTVAIAQALIAVISGLAIFALVFANNIPPTEGPGLLFMALPVALAQMPFGQLWSIVLFLLMSLAAVTATMVILEAIVAVTTRVVPLRRSTVIWSTAALIWAGGAVTALSFNVWDDVQPLTWIGIASTRNPFGLLDYLTSNILMPLGGLLLALMAGWALPRKVLADEANLAANSLRMRLFQTGLRYITPIAVTAVFITLVMA